MPRGSPVPSARSRWISWRPWRACRGPGLRRGGRPSAVASHNAATNKCLARTNKSRARAEATKKRRTRPCPYELTLRRCGPVALARSTKRLASCSSKGATTMNALKRLAGRLIGACALATLIPVSLQAATFKPINGGKAIVLTGDIKGGDSARLARAIVAVNEAGARVERLYLNSGGG